MRRWSSSVLLTGVNLVALLAVSQAFIPSGMSPLARVAKGGDRLATTGKKQGSDRGVVGVTMASRRDVLRMPSSEPMVREKRGRKELQRCLVHRMHHVRAMSVNEPHRSSKCRLSCQRCGRSSFREYPIVGDAYLIILALYDGPVCPTMYVFNVLVVFVELC